MTRHKGAHKQQPHKDDNTLSEALTPQCMQKQLSILHLLDYSWNFFFFFFFFFTNFAKKRGFLKIKKHEYSDSGAQRLQLTGDSCEK